MPAIEAMLDGWQVVSQQLLVDAVHQGLQGAGAVGGESPDGDVLVPQLDEESLGRVRLHFGAILDHGLLTDKEVHHHLALSLNQTEIFKRYRIKTFIMDPDIQQRFWNWSKDPESHMVPISDDLDPK